MSVSLSACIDSSSSVSHAVSLPVVPLEAQLDKLGPRVGPSEWEAAGLAGIVTPNPNLVLT